jgi:hypothetical protein
MKEEIYYYTFPRFKKNDAGEWSYAGILTSIDGSSEAYFEKELLGSYSTLAEAAAALNVRCNDVDADVASAGWSKRVFATLEVQAYPAERPWW